MTPDHWKQADRHRGNNWIEYAIAADKDQIDRLHTALRTDYPNHEWKVAVLP